VLFGTCNIATLPPIAIVRKRNNWDPGWCANEPRHLRCPFGCGCRSSFPSRNTFLVPRFACLVEIDGLGKVGIPEVRSISKRPALLWVVQIPHGFPKRSASSVWIDQSAAQGSRQQQTRKHRKDGSADLYRAAGEPVVDIHRGIETHGYAKLRCRHFS
jgi:hypothetical protein